MLNYTFCKLYLCNKTGNVYKMLVVALSTDCNNSYSYCSYPTATGADRVVEWLQTVYFLMIKVQFLTFPLCKVKSIGGYLNLGDIVGAAKFLKMKLLLIAVLFSLFASCATPCVYMKSSPYRVVRGDLRMHSFTR
jgi:hypothetical protein